MPDRFVRLARTRLDVTDLDLARNLGVTVGCLRELGSQGRASLRPAGALRADRRDRTGGRRAFADAGPLETERRICPRE